MSSINTTKAFFKYLNFNNADLFTIVCLPNETEKFPTIILRTPYVDADECLPEEQLCQNKLAEFSC